MNHSRISPASTSSPHQLRSDLSLLGRVTVVSAASRGAGLAIAQVLGEAGATVGPAQEPDELRTALFGIDHTPDIAVRGVVTFMESMLRTYRVPSIA